MSKAPSERESKALRAARALKQVNLEKMQKQLMNVLARDTAWLLKASVERQLSRDEAHALATYLKLVKSLKSAEQQELDGLSEEQLREIAQSE